MIFDKWQQEVIDYKGSVTIRAGRQVGKSTTVGKRRAEQMLEYKDSISLIIAPAQRQSSQLFAKTMSWLQLKHEEVLAKAGGFKASPKYSIKRNSERRRQFENDKGIFNETPTKTTIVLKKDFSKPQHINNQGSVCYALPAGKTGVYLRTYSLDFLDIDEAAYVPENVYTALRPMLAVSQKKRGLGWESLLSTPFGKGGFFYDSHHSADYRQWHISSEKCERISSAFLKKEKERLTKIEYAQEYLGEFVDEFQQFFPTALIKQQMTFMSWDFKTDYKKDCKYFLGVDFARYGQDENAFVVAEMQPNGFMRVVNVETTERVSLDKTYTHILMKDDKYNFNRIFVDDGGLGAGITDMLIAKLGRRVLGLNNASRTVDPEGKKGKIFKEDLYSHASMLLEQGKLEMINSVLLARSLKSMTFEYTSDKNVRITGKYSHLAEAFVRACWAPKAKGLKLFVY